MTWTPPAGYADRLQAQLAEVSEGALPIAGRLYAIERAELVPAALSAAAARWIERLDDHIDALHETVFELVDALASERGAALGALDRWTELQLSWWGACAAGAAIEDARVRWSEALEEARVALAPCEHYLVAHNTERASALALVAPSKRAELFWLTRGVGIDERSVGMLSAVAELVARFPSAEEELRRLSGIARLLHEARGAQVISIRDWLEQKRGRAVEVLADVVGMSDEGASWWIDRDDVRVALAGPSHIVVHVLASSEGAPHLLRGDGRIEVGSPSSLSEGLYEIVVPGVREDEPLRLRIPLRGGVLELDLATAQ